MLQYSYDKTDVCWAFTTATCVEYGRKIHNLDETQVRLSPQHLVNWIDPEKEEEPGRGYTFSHRKGMEWVQLHGIAPESEVAYMSRIGPRTWRGVIFKNFS